MMRKLRSLRNLEENLLVLHQGLLHLRDYLNICSRLFSSCRSREPRWCKQCRPERLEPFQVYKELQPLAMFHRQERTGSDKDSGQ